MKIGILTMEKYENRPFNSVGSSRIRGRWLINHWDEAEEFQFGKQYDVVIYQKVYWQRHMKSFNGIKIFDVCDKDWPERPIREIIDLVDLVTTSTESLAQEVRRYIPENPNKVICIPDRVDLEELQPAYSLDDRIFEGGIKTALWYGYAHNLDAIRPAVYDLEKRRIKLTLLTDREGLMIAGSESFIEGRIFNYDELPHEFANHDVVLNPHLDFGRFALKSNNKSIIAMACGCPVATTLDELEALNDSNVRRQSIIDGLKEVSENWDVRLSVEEYKKAIADLL